MNTVDIVLIVLLALFVLQGWRQGFVLALGRLIGAIIAFWVANHWSAPFSSILGQWIHVNSGLLQFITFVLIFVIVDRLFGLIVWIANKILRLVTMLPLISTVNGLLGAILGLASGVILVGSAVYVVLSLRLDPTLIQWATNSSVARYTEQIFYQALKFII